MRRSVDKVVAITGASGLLGTHLCSHFAARGWWVRAGLRNPSRYPSRHPRISTFRCELPDHLDKAGLADADVCIHTAYATRPMPVAAARQVNEEGTRAVLMASRRAGVRTFVFISSCSAHERALSYYGRSKFALEKKLQLQRDLVIRPGLILAEQGLFRRLCDYIRHTRIIPLFDGGRQVVQTIHIEDLCSAILLAIDRNLKGCRVLAEPEGILMRDLLASIAHKMGRRPVFVPLPIAMLLVLLRLFETLRIPFFVSSENLLGLKSMEHQESAKDLAELGISVRSARQSLDDLL